MKKLYIKTFGCQMNVYDSSKMVDLMKNQGYEVIDIPNDADLIIVNTCHIREKVKEKIFAELGKFKKFKKAKLEKGGYMVIAVAGCVAQTEGDEIFRRMPIVDVVVGPASYHKLTELVENAISRQEFSRTRDVATEFLNEEKFDILPITKSVKNISEFVTIQEGCNKFCSYCIVPYTRGREFSRKPEGIIEEINALVKNGVKEVFLLGQNVDNYKGVDKDGNVITLAGLIKIIAEIDGVKRIRYTTSYPSQVTQDLIDAHKNIEKLMPYIHLPIQSGSDEVLKSMNRKYTVEQYLEVVKKIREARPDIAISSDFIVGFAGETEEQFQETFELVKKVKFAQAFSFMYSPRRGTRGAKMTNQIDEDVKADRLARLQEVLNAQQFEFNQQFEGRIIPVLVEGISKRSKNALFGKTPHMQSIVFDCSNKSIDELLGEIVNVKITEVSMRGLKGVIEG
jgi:tRNA-2-methylthio-N6-dimethylallyladenosine synthase